MASAKPSKPEESPVVAEKAPIVDHHAAERAQLREQLAHAHVRIDELKTFIRTSIREGLNYTHAHEQVNK